MHTPDTHPTLPAPHTGVLLLNLGTPEAPTKGAVRRYLAEFLSDRRVIEAPRWFWLPLLHGIILRTRPRRSAHAYNQIWDNARGESPLKTHTRALAEALAERLAPRGITVRWAMRYGSPSTASLVADMAASGCRNIIALALYPQYSATTTATAYDAVFHALSRLRWQPSVTTLGPYHDHPLYIKALADSVRAALGDATPDALVVSFHGLPKKYFDAGDPYYCHCQKTSRLLREALGWDTSRWHTSFQSRFGPTEWLKPYTSEVITQLAREGKKHIAVISPGFVCDCLETLEELNIGLREAFLAAGGERFTYIPCLNASEGHVALLEQLTAKA